MKRTFLNVLPMSRLSVFLMPVLLPLTTRHKSASSIFVSYYLIAGAFSPKWYDRLCCNIMEPATEQVTEFSF